jgi:hypothetical protein
MSTELNYLSENKRNLLCCDQLFAVYLRDCSQFCNKATYLQLLTFTLMFHDALNQYGWQRRAQYECRELYGYPEYEAKLQEKLEALQAWAASKLYSSVNNCEFVPEIANDFVMDYLEKEGNNKAELPRESLINFTQHLCHYLFVNHLSCSKIALLPDQLRT